MFTIDSEALLKPYRNGVVADLEDSGTYINSKVELAALIGAKPGEWAVRLWNQLPGVTPIHTPPGEPTAKFRNKQTAVERIWQKLCELYPDAVASEDMPKAKTHAKTVSHAAPHRARTRKVASHPKSSKGKTREAGTKNGRKSAWAEELTEALRKQFNPGDTFELQDVYKLIPQFQRRHKENHHVAARLRTTLAQDLRGAGIVKTTAKGKYRMA